MPTPLARSFDINMKTTLFEFESPAFEITPSEDGETNPGIYGRSLSLWLSVELNEHGFTTEEVIPEDFGWCIPIESENHSLFVTCASADDEPTHWLVFGFVEGGFLSRLFGKDSRQESISKLNSVLSVILKESPQIHNLCEEEAE